MIQIKHKRKYFHSAQMNKNHWKRKERKMSPGGYKLVRVEERGRKQSNFKLTMKTKI